MQSLGILLAGKAQMAYQTCRFRQWYCEVYQDPGDNTSLFDQLGNPVSLESIFSIFRLENVATVCSVFWIVNFTFLCFHITPTGETLEYYYPKAKNRRPAENDYKIGPWKHDLSYHCLNPNTANTKNFAMKQFDLGNVFLNQDKKLLQILFKKFILLSKVF